MSQRDWHPWFAWRPVRRWLRTPEGNYMLPVSPTGRFWLRRIERRVNAGDLTDGWWQYRDPLTVRRPCV